MSKQPPPAPTARTVGPCPTLIQTSRTPRHWKFTQDHRTTRPPPEKEKEADRRRGGKTISKSGQEWTWPAQLGQLKTGQDGKGLLQIHLWCPDDLPRLWDRIE